MQLFIGNRCVDVHSPIYIVAEMSGNHKGNKDAALAIVRKAKEVGADAIKLQTYRADTITLNSEKADFAISKDDPWHYKKNL